MLNPQAETLIITSKCSARCTPCPFGSGLLPHRFLPAEQIVERLRSSKAPLVVLTGGEPLEYPEFDRLVALIESETASKSLAPFRIATGGHIAFSLCLLERLKRIPSFTGVSLGTDVLTEVCPGRADHSVTWNQNVKMLNRLGVPYSLTLTVHQKGDGNTPEGSPVDIVTDDARLDCLGPLKVAAQLEVQPQFIYLRIFQSELLSEKDITKVRAIFGGSRVLFDRV